MRLLKFIGVFLSVFIIIAALIILPSLKSVRTIIQNYDHLNEGSQYVQQVSTTGGFLNYIEAHPDRVSIYSYTPGQPDSTINYNGDRMRSVGALSALVSVAAYAHMVDTGTLNADELIPLDSINQYRLPGISVDNHRKALSEIATSGNDKHAVQLRQIVRMAVQDQDLPAADYLFWKIGPARLDSTLKDLQIKNLEAPLPWTGLYISMNPKVNHQSASDLLKNFSRKNRQTQRSIIINNAHRFKSDPSFHDLVVNSFKDGGADLTFAQERAAYTFLPHATARSLVNLVNEAWQDSLYNANTSKIFLDTFKWDNMASLMKQVFTWYGGSFDSRMSILSGVDAGTASRFGYSRIQAVILDSLPIQLWLHLSSQYSNQTLQRRLIWDPSFHRITYNRLVLHKTVIDSMVIDTQPK